MLDIRVSAVCANPWAQEVHPSLHPIQTGDVMADTLVKIDGIAGEFQDEFHPGEIQINSWRWKIAQQSSMLSGSGGGAAKATINDVEFVYQIDRVSPNLMRYCLTGGIFPRSF
jgi:type VI secretion system secreted protein Hcp